MSGHDDNNTMAKITSPEPRTSEPTTSKAGGVTKKRVKLAKNLAATKIYDTTATILEPTT